MWDVRKVLIPVLETYHTDSWPKNSYSKALSDIEDVLYFLKEICHAELEEKLAPNLESEEELGKDAQLAKKENVEVEK